MSQQLTYSAIVDELLELVGLTTDDVPAQIPAQVTLEGPQLAQKQKLIREYEDKYQNGPAGGSEAQNKALSEARFLFTRMANHSLSTPEDLSKAFDTMAAAVAKIRTDVARVKAAREKLLTTVTVAAPESALPDVAAGAMPSESQPLREARLRLTAALAAPKGDKPEPAPTVLQGLVTEVEDFVVNVNTVKQQVQLRTAAREKQTRNLAVVIAPGVTVAQTIVAGSTDGDVKDLIRDAGLITATLRDMLSTLDILDAQAAKISDLKVVKSKISDKVAARLLRRAEIEKKAREIEDQLPEESDPEALSTHRDELIQALKTTPLGDLDIGRAEKALESLEADLESEKENTKSLASRRTGFKARLQEITKLIAETCEEYNNLDDVEEDRKAIQRELNGALYLIDFDGTGGSDVPLDDRLDQVLKTLDTALMEKVREGSKSDAPPPVDYLKRSAAAAVADGARLLPFAPKLAAKLNGLEKQREAVDTLLTVDEPEATVEDTPKKKTNTKSKTQKPPPKVEKKPPSRDNLEKAFDIISAMRSLIEEARKEAGTVSQQISDWRDSLLERLLPVNPSALPPGYAVILDEERQIVSDVLGPQFTTALTLEKIKGAARDTGRFERDLIAAANIGKSWTGSEKRFTDVHKDARTPIQSALTERRAAVLTAGKAKAAASDLPGAETLCQALTDLLDRSTNEAGETKSAKETIGKVSVDSALLDPETTDLIYDLAGPEAASLDPAGLLTLGTAFKKASKAERASLASLVTEGFGGEGKILLSLVRQGDPAGILALANGYGGPGAKDDRKRLRGLIEQGGLAEAPTVLDDLLGFGVNDPAVLDKQARREQNVNQMKALGLAFGDDEGPALMKNLVKDCGLGKPRPEKPPRPGVMAELLQGSEGFDGDASKLRGFAEGFAGDDPAEVTDRDRVKGLIDDGGFGNRPKAFAPLIKTMGGSGVDGGVAASKLKEVGATFEQPADRAKLKKMLEQGGISGDTGDLNRKHEHPDTLAKVFNDGLKQKADKLKEFTDAFGDTDIHAEESRKMMEAWNEYPDGNKDSRQPGKKVARLLAPNHFCNDVSKLQSQFTTKMKLFGDDTKRKQATRMAPHFDKKPVGAFNGLQPGPIPPATNVVTGYIMQRHMPEFAKDGQKANGDDWLAASNSYYPPDMTPLELMGVIEEAMGAVGAPGLGGNATVASKGMTVHAAVKANGSMPHCYPVTGPAPPDPKEVAVFTKTEAERIFAAVAP